MESPLNPRDIDSPASRRVIWSFYFRVHGCELIAGKWFVQLTGCHDKLCFDWQSNPPFEKGEMVKVTYEKVVQ